MYLSVIVIYMLLYYIQASLGLELIEIMTTCSLIVCLFCHRENLYLLDDILFSVCG